MSLLTVSDILTWNRCRRQWIRDWSRRAGEPHGINPPDLIQTALMRETARVAAIGAWVFGERCEDLNPVSPGHEPVPVPVQVLNAAGDEALAREWYGKTQERISARECFRNGLIVHEDVAVVVDLARYRPKSDGWELFLFRPGTGLRGAFEDEAALVHGVCQGEAISLHAIRLVYLDKKTRRPVTGFAESERDFWKSLFRESNLTGRAGKRWNRVSGELADLRRARESGRIDDENYRCRQGCSLCEPTDDRGRLDSRFDVLTLHKGRHIGRELQKQGVFDIRDLNTGTCRLTDRQLIQVQTVVSGEPHIDSARLGRFLESLQWPVYFLDFEAYSQSVPPMAGLSPYEHVPVIASLHSQKEPNSDPEARSFVCKAGVDERAKLFEWLQVNLGQTGSIVVFSKTFESAMVHQLAQVAGQVQVGESLIQRMVDLLVPFSEFMVYHPDQLGKVSLKRVLPVFTRIGYETVHVQDGMEANLICTRQADYALLHEDTEQVVGKPDIIGAAAAESVSRFLERSNAGPGVRETSMEDVARYCAMDTQAMVELVRVLFQYS